MGDGEAKAASGVELLGQGEEALKRGDSKAAFELLTRATSAGVDAAELNRLASAYASAGRYLSRHSEVLDWIEAELELVTQPELRAKFLRARIAVCRQLDLGRVLDLAPEALSAAEANGDEESYASILSHAAFAGYRRGDNRAARDYAELAATRTFTSTAAHYDAVRAQMFLAVSRGDHEDVLNLATKARAMARELGRIPDAANESGNLAEAYLELGCPAEARACARAAIEMATQCGHISVERFGSVLEAIARAELGEIDEAIDSFADVCASLDSNRVFAVDAAAVHGYWLLERGAARDATLAREIAEGAIESATRAGVHNRLTALYSTVARAYAREGNERSARVALEQARQSADRAEPRGQRMLALAVAEVLPVSEPKRKVVLTNARARILRNAGYREDPNAFCTHVRLNRRLLELSGGVPDDLPRAE
jgi:tetratricopeptide (TPR) repeat protein